MAVVSQSDLILQRQEWKRNGKRLVCVAGAFDLLHPGHVRLLEQARGLGDALVVALQGDESVRRPAARLGADAKSIPARPITPAAERAEILAALAAVDYVTVIEEGSASDFIARLAPEVLAQGNEASAPSNVLIDEGAIKAAGGRVVRVALEPGYSTSLLVARIAELHA